MSERAVDAPRPRQPQRHDGGRPDGPRRLAAEARRRHPHRPHATGLRPQAVRGVCLVERRERGGPPAGAARRRPAEPPRTTKPACWRRASRRRSRIAAGKTKFLAPGEEEEDGVSKMGRAAAKLCRLAFELAKAPDVAAMAELALAGLAEGTQTDAGALLLLAGQRPGRAARRRPGGRSPRGAPRSTATIACPNFLASTVMREGEAVLARNVIGRQHAGQPRQPGRNPRHQRASAPRSAAAARCSA